WLFFDENSDEIYKRKYWNFDLSVTQIDETRVYFNSLSLEKKNEIIDFLKKNEIINDNDRYKFIFFLKNELYSFAKFGKFYQIIFNKQKLLTLNNCDKTFYSLQSFVYKPYLYEVKSMNIFSKILEFLGIYFIQSIISQTKFYRLVRKLCFNPKGFFKDSRKINFKKLNNESN
ncbi:sugar transferase, partial [Campylobacter jejuni]|nr:sugar transferase [Campylobacter jejuni]